MPMRLLRSLAVAALICAGALSAQAQSLLQSGAFVSGHASMYVTSGIGQAVISDAGPAAGGGQGVGLSELGLAIRGIGTGPFANAGTGPLAANLCDYDAPTTNTGGYHFLCFSPNAQGGGLIAYGASRGAPALPLSFVINGATYQFPITVGGITGPTASTIGDIACWNNTVGTLMSDCGVTPSSFGTLAGTNSWSGANNWAGASTFAGPVTTNNTVTANSTLNAAGPLNSSAGFNQSGTANFTGVLKVAGTTETFPASGSLVGTSDTQTLTNKNISAGQITGSFAVSQGGTSLTSLTANGLVLGAGTSAPTFLLGTSVAQVPTWNGTTWVAGSVVPRSYLAGLNLSNDSGTPNSVIDISAGTAADTSNTIPIVLGAFTKSTAGNWVIGTGSNGMGPGLTIANATWYDVCAAVINGVADVYFDTAVSGQTPCNQHPPALTTAFRRVGSFKTDGSAHILAFSQLADNFVWTTETQDQNTTLAATPANFTVNVPPGVQVLWQGQAFISNNGSSNEAGVRLYSPSQADIALNVTGAAFASIGNTTVIAAGVIASVRVIGGPRAGIVTNTLGQIRAVSDSVGNGFLVNTEGWVDYRGRFN